MSKGFLQNHSLIVQIPEDIEKKRHSGSLYGNIQGKRLIVGGFESAEFEIGQELIIRMVMDGSVVGFWATVMESFKTDETCYLLTYPEQFETLSLRKSERMSVFIPAEIHISMSSDDGSEQHQFEGILTNISNDGCCLNSKNPIPSDMYCKLSFTLPGDSHQYILEGKVVRQLTEKEAFQQGVQFVNDQNNLLAMSDIRSWITQNITLAMS